MLYTSPKHHRMLISATVLWTFQANEPNELPQVVGSEFHRQRHYSSGRNGFKNLWTISSRIFALDSSKKSKRLVESVGDDDTPLKGTDDELTPASKAGSTKKVSIDDPVIAQLEEKLKGE